MQPLLDYIKKQLASLQQQIFSLQKDNSHIIYDTAKGLLGQHITLNDNVPKDVGCAEAVSYVLKKSGVNIPNGGIAGTSTLCDFLQHSSVFKEVFNYEIGAVIVSPTGSGNGKIEGHTGICAIYGILSNDSSTGLFSEQWNIQNWKQYYNVYGGLSVRYFAYIGG